jgi:cytochrome c peroxidase
MRLSVALLCVILVVSATLALAGQDGADYRWDLPPRVAPPRRPADKPMTGGRVGLGRRLFYDARLSGNGTKSCATCHVQSLAFTDGRARGLGATGEGHARSPMSLVNVAYREIR